MTIGDFYSIRSGSLCLSIFDREISEADVSIDAYGHGGIRVGLAVDLKAAERTLSVLRQSDGAREKNLALTKGNIHIQCAVRGEYFTSRQVQCCLSKGTIDVSAVELFQVGYLHEFTKCAVHMDPAVFLIVFRAAFAMIYILRP